ncbi:MAG: hypothetical protein KQI35_10390 [Bacteroidetes bacterium]|nr:hypothetical protein [Bacteroidota bacterium]
MIKKAIHYSGLLIFIAMLSSCLTVEKKIYTFELKDNNTGTLTIKYINILSMTEDTADVSREDFDELISSYIDGNEIELEFQNAQVRGKRLFEENGQLCGEVIIDFNDLASVGLFQYDSKSPFMFNVGSFLDSETYLKSNGDYGGDIMPVVFWSRSMKELSLTTYVTDPDETTFSLLDEYKNWR